MRIRLEQSSRGVPAIDSTIAGMIAILGLAAGCAAQTGSDHRPVVSPDGRTLAFMSDRSGTWSVYTMPLDGSSPAVRVSANPNGEWYADWSPDGRSLVYHRSEAGSNRSSLYRWDMDSRTERRLGPVDGDRSGARWPRPDTILYVCRGTGICSMSADGVDRGVAFGLAGDRHDPALSPDGKWIAYVDALDSGAQDAFVASVDGTDRRRITNDPGRTYGLDWSPDSRYIGYNTEIDGNAEIFIHDLTTGERRRLTTDPGEDHLPRWSPDGRFLYFTSDRTGTEHVYRIRPDGTGLERVRTDAR